MHIVVQPTVPRLRSNSPRMTTLCSDIAGLTALPASLFIADEAGLTVTVDGGRPTPVRALLGLGGGDDFSQRISLIATVPGFGMIEHSHHVELGGTVGDAINDCATELGASIALALFDAQKSGDMLVLDNSGDVLGGGSILNSFEGPTDTESAAS